ncbi:MAG TPA: hypothetical protein VN253_13685 [Kofleriaceae bacterium]|nr:hypothetical protein [Kofleriaceae bacterium]
MLDLDATVARAGLGLACDPPPDLRVALLGMRCEASTYAAQLLGVVLPDAEELMRSAPPGSIPWAQSVLAYIEGMLMAGRIDDLLAAAASLREVEPVPEAVGRMALGYVATILILDAIGRIPDGNVLAERFEVVVRAAGEREPIAQFWWHVMFAMRSAYAYEDPWNGREHGGAIRAIFDAIGGERVFMNMQMWRSVNLCYLGELEEAERALSAIPAADESLGVASSNRRFHLAWLLADRGVLDEARALATQLAEYGHAHQLSLEEGRGRWGLAEVLRRSGDLDAADREVQVALAMAAPLERTGVLGTLAALRLAQGRPAEALAVAEEAVAGIAAMGGCGLFRGAFVRLAHAEALHATGALDAARAAIGEARARLLAIVDRIPAGEPRQRFLEQIPENARTVALARAWLGEAGPSA